MKDEMKPQPPSHWRKMPRGVYPESWSDGKRQWVRDEGLYPFRVVSVVVTLEEMKARKRKPAELCAWFPYTGAS